eukprot:5079117-Prymnesium_polylepis.2
MKRFDRGRYDSGPGEYDTRKEQRPADIREGHINEQHASRNAVRQQTGAEPGPCQAGSCAQR